MKQFFLLIAASMLAITSSFAQDGEREFADYGIGLGISPFGPAINLTHNFSEQTSVVIGIGGFGVSGTGFELDFNGRKYTPEGESSWMGVFVNHRPFADASWFRVNSGIGIGGIQGTLTTVDPVIHGDEYDTYDIRYANNPVGYLGVGLGSKPVKGIQVGFDLGILTTAGPTITRTTDPVEAAAHPEVADISGDIPNNIFFGRMLPNAQLTVTYGF